ncbi:DUF4386 domain-containing protein [Actinoplanes sp. L3-i22]|uniref:DUF4386 domain-containing protein n=1 Tax=Actinoplanes sp. L3-i22 TaxID=2836373 RepID=UPI001C7811B4|nr:DUF4386 domain-containing protein [Actinoplanes sp. L3-i22]BCY10561.1 hypothetical protein L3i22_056490 [Actinoplanes sp. L3-i22]
MDTNRRAFGLIGALFLVALFTNGIGSELAESTTNHRLILTGELLELICGVAVVGIGALAFTVFRQVSPGLATAHLGFRVIEAAVNAMIVLSTLTAAELVGPARDVLLEQRYQAQLIAIYTFSCSGVAWYVLLHRFRVVPRWLTVLGLAGVAVLLIGSVVDLYGADLDMLLYGAPMGLTELVIGIWLLTGRARVRASSSDLRERGGRNAYGDSPDHAATG